jgi:hypothetical protein
MPVAEQWGIISNGLKSSALAYRQAGTGRGLKTLIHQQKNEIPKS